MVGSQLQDIVGINIKRIRKTMKLTQAQLAEMAGISTGYMCDIERSRRWPSAENLARLADVLKVDPFQLLLPTDDSPYFDRHRTLTAFNNQLQEAFLQSAADVYDRMLQPYGPRREDESGARSNGMPDDDIGDQTGRSQTSGDNGSS